MCVLGKREKREVEEPTGMCIRIKSHKGVAICGEFG